MSTYNDTPEWLFNLDLELSDCLQSIECTYSDAAFKLANIFLASDEAAIVGTPEPDIKEALVSFTKTIVDYNRSRIELYKNIILKYENNVARYTYNNYSKWGCGLITHKELIDSLIAPLHANDIVINSAFKP